MPTKNREKVSQEPVRREKSGRAEQARVWKLKGVEPLFTGEKKVIEQELLSSLETL